MGGGAVLSRRFITDSFGDVFLDIKTRSAKLHRQLLEIKSHETWNARLIKRGTRHLDKKLVGTNVSLINN